MFGESPFYHASIRKILVAFGKIFTDLAFERYDNDGNVIQKIKVPVAPGSMEKWMRRLQEDPNLSGRTQIVLPRIGFELTGFQYNPQRKMMTLNNFSASSKADYSDLANAYAPVPYDLYFKLYVACKTQGDALQIVEQILPYFTPDYTVTVKMFPDVGITQDVPFVLNGVSMTDNYDGTFEDKRLVLYELEFVGQATLLGPAKKGGDIILHTRIKLGEGDPLSRLNSWDANDDGSITGDWTDIQ